ncbi:MAG: potassium-transporting ATPase subunit KdpC [Spirochaetia bacterium]|nr:potassium-transporting ATPase subunit KdpC [Spirochaetia bacterium]
MMRLFTALRLYLLLVLIVGLAYPALIAVVGSTFFRGKATGSIAIQKGTQVGSELLAQKFENPRYFWPRPSAADFATVASGASQLGPTSEKFRSNVVARIEFVRKAHPDSAGIPIPADFLTTSASGLDPHLSPESVLFQLGRVAKARSLSLEQKEKLRELIDRMTEKPFLGMIGERQVNVLLLNMKLEEI